MEDKKRNKLYEMLDHMSNYSNEQPKAIQDLCKDLFISPAYGPVMDLMVEAFLTVRSFSLLMFDGLISNASAILRILIEQVATITVIARDPKALTEYLKFQTKKKQYYGSLGKEHEEIRELLFQECGYKHKNENALKDYLDYGWIRILNNNKNERGDKLIIKEARLEEFIVDINEQLNAFAHGQRSIFSFLRNKDLADKHVSRIIMAAGKLFLFLCNAKHELLVTEDMSSDKFYVQYLDAKLLYLDLNARAVNSRIVDYIKTSNNLDRDIVYSLSVINHMRGLMYQSELDFIHVNYVARAYIIDLINFMYMICYKLFKVNDDFFEGITDFSSLIIKVGLEKIEPYYNGSAHVIPLGKLIEFINLNDDSWGPMKSDGQMAELDEAFMTDFTTLIYSLFEAKYSSIDVEELTKSFVPID